jgi:uncharacterized protein
MNALPERAVSFSCRGEHLLGILHPAAATHRRPGILIIVGGPQYRAGSHRHFVELARGWASRGYPVFRFDCRGMGDSTGVFPGFERTAEDVRAAIDTFLAEVPDLAGVVLYGLCDAAAAALIYCVNDSRLAGLILANPWVRTAHGEARSYVQHYYGQRLLQPDFWRKLLTGKLNVVAAMFDFVRKLWSMQSGGPAEQSGGPQSFIDRMLLGLERSRLPALLLLSGQDLTAQEFRSLCSSSSRWQAAVSQSHVATEAFNTDHTFSSAAAKAQVMRASLCWLSQLAGTVRSAEGQLTAVDGARASGQLS